jgi:peptidoglycan/LPS O-acetylase OafA/YrhL
VLLLLTVLWQLHFIDREVSWSFIWLSSIYLANMTPMFGISIQFGVLWSLAVEEHFYLLWPTCIRWLGVRGIAITAFTLCVGASVLRVVAFKCGFDVFGHYTWLVIDGLAMGALLAVALRSLDRKALWRVSGLAFIFSVLCIYIDKAFRHVLFGGALHITGLNAFFASVLMLILLLGSRFPIRISFLEFVGEISYGIYLTHILLFELYDHFIKGIARGLSDGNGHFSIMLFRFCVVSIVTIGFCYLSRSCYEDRFLRLKDRFAPPPFGNGEVRCSESPGA